MGFNDWKLSDADDYESHRKLVDEAKRQTYATRAKPKNPRPPRKRRRKPGPRKKPRKKYVSKKAKEKQALLATFSTGELRGEVARRNTRQRYLEMTPEQRKAQKQKNRERMQALNRLIRENCTHPKPREGKKRPRHLYCPRCKNWFKKPPKEKPQPKYEVIK